MNSLGVERASLMNLISILIHLINSLPILSPFSMLSLSFLYALSLLYLCVLSPFSMLSLYFLYAFSLLSLCVLSPFSMLSLSFLYAVSLLSLCCLSPLSNYAFSLLSLCQDKHSEASRWSASVILSPSPWLIINQSKRSMLLDNAAPRMSCQPCCLTTPPPAWVVNYVA